jgi:AcrR family transcriptional regulator
LEEAGLICDSCAAGARRCDESMRSTDDTRSEAVAELKRGSRSNRDLATQSRTRRALLLAALYEFGRHGCRGTSVREITRRARARNSSALHYHFKSKVALITELLDVVQQWFDANRGEQLESLEKNVALGAAVNVRELCEAFVYPYVRLIETEKWGLSAIRFLAYIELEQDPNAWRAQYKRASGQALRLLKLLQAANPTAEQPDLRRRTLFFANAVIFGLASHKHLELSFFGDAQPKTLAELGEFYVSFGERLLSGT